MLSCWPVFTKSLPEKTPAQQASRFYKSTQPFEEPALCLIRQLRTSAFICHVSANYIHPNSLSAFLPKTLEETNEQLSKKILHD
jgi:hypothetical protein